jgi:hypothetical protein
VLVGPISVADLGETEDCRACPAGTAAPVPDSLQCAPCQPGTVAPGEAFSQCAACDAVTYQPQFGQTACLPCQADASTTQGARDLAECLCDPGFYGFPGRECTTCPSLDTYTRCAERGQIIPLPLPGYFIDITSTAEANAPTVRACFPPKACSGLATVEDIVDDVRPYRAQCAPGYELIGCSKCQGGYYRYSGDCLQCPKTDVGVFFLMFFMIVMFIVCLPMLAKLMRRFKAISIGLIFLQVTAIFADLHFNWPGPVAAMMAWFSAFNFNLVGLSG